MVLLKKGAHMVMVFLFHASWVEEGKDQKRILEDDKIGYFIKKKIAQDSFLW